MASEHHGALKTTDTDCRKDETLRYMPESQDDEPSRYYSVFTESQKRAIILSGSFFGLLSYMSSSIFYPALNQVRISAMYQSLTLTWYRSVGTLAFQVQRSTSPLQCFSYASKSQCPTRALLTRSIDHPRDCAYHDCRIFRESGQTTSIYCVLCHLHLCKSRLRATK